MFGSSRFQNPNADWYRSPGLWIAYISLILIAHLILLAFPLWSVATAWTVTNCVHNVLTFFLLHMRKGTPWLMNDQGRARSLTTWEQIDHECQHTSTRKFLTLVPVALFFLSSYYTEYDFVHFLFNFFTLILVLLPKAPCFHQVRLFGINKY